jgi:hypothetical protein
MKPMKRISWLTQSPSLLKVIPAVAFLVVACSEPVDFSAKPSTPPGQLKKQEKAANESSNNSIGTANYSIKVTKDGTVWTYEICRGEGAKGISHFILDLDNCSRSDLLNIESIEWATVNGQPAKLESSEGNTGCDVSSVTSRFVKFDDLPEADTYIIKFELEREYGNVFQTTAWIKAGQACYSFVVDGPCCPI